MGSKGIDALRNAAPIKTHCKRCGAAFEKEYPRFRQEFCSKECQHASELEKQRAVYRKRHKSEAKTVTRICRQCGRAFGAMYTQQYCAECVNGRADPHMNKLYWQRKAV